MADDFETDDDDSVAALVASAVEAEGETSEDDLIQEMVDAVSLDFVEDDEDEEEEDGLFVSEGDAADLSRPWMKFHKFELVTTVEKVRQIIDRALEVGRVSLDLETEGFDNRIDYDENGKPYTIHKIVGYCLGLEGEGYYIPVRHRYDATYGGSPNVDSVEETEKEITRLCVASQPVIKPEALQLDPFSSRDYVEGGDPKVVIEFWHAKFDQEFLYPVTGIDMWHPESFEDGMLAVYALYTDDDQGLKDNAKLKLDPIQDGDQEHYYEMIEFKDLFPKGMKKSERRFYDLTPSTQGSGWNVVLYGCSDAICTNLLCKKLVPEANGPRFQHMYRIEKQVAQVVRLLERYRILIDKQEIIALLREAEEELALYEQKIRKFAALSGFKDLNPGSSEQLAEYLFSQQGLDLEPKPDKTSEGQYKTDEKTLEALHESNPSSDVLLWVIKHRQINKVKGTYLQNLANNTDDLNQLRLNFKPTGAATGRFTAPKGEPDHGYGGVPIQGIPARDDPKKPKVAHSLRRVFIARPGYIMVKVDYASQELRIAANVSGEKKWIAEYDKEAETGEPADLHFLTAQAFYPGLKKGDADYKLKRNAGKTANFALIYGGGVGAVQRATGCDKVEGARLKKAFDESVPQFSKWVKKQHDSVKKNLGVRTAFGRFIAIPDANITADDVLERMKAKAKREAKAKGVDFEWKPTREMKKEAWQQSKKEQAACERKSTNFPIQGSGADILKLSLIMLAKELTLRGWLRDGDDSVRMIMTVHDEIVFEVRKERVAEAVPVILRVMEYPTYLTRNPEWKVPLIAEAELGDSWSAKLDWLKMLAGDPEHPVPDYIDVSKVVKDPPLLIPLAGNGQLKKKMAAGELPASTVAPKIEPPKATPPKEEKKPEPPKEEKEEEVAAPKEDEVADEVEAVVASEPPPASKPPSRPPPSSKTNGHTHTEYVVFTLGQYHITPAMVKAVFLLAQASAVMGDDSVLRPVEFRRPLDGGVLYPVEDNYLVWPEDLQRRLRESGFGSIDYEVVSFDG